jgi:hypothetical protein
MSSRGLVRPSGLGMQARRVGRAVRPSLHCICTIHPSLSCGVEVRLELAWRTLLLARIDVPRPDLGLEVFRDLASLEACIVPNIELHALRQHSALPAPADALPRGIIGAQPETRMVNPMTNTMMLRMVFGLSPRARSKNHTLKSKTRRATDFGHFGPVVRSSPTSCRSRRAQTDTSDVSRSRRKIIDAVFTLWREMP